MHSFRIKIGNVVADVQSEHSYLLKICEPYFSNCDANCKITIDQQSIENERSAALEMLQNGETLETEISDWFLEVYVLLHKLLPVLPVYDMLFLHGSAIQYRGKAYVFVAPSGTGKSTHTRLWKERFGDDVIVINDDKPFLAFRNKKVFLYGTPWRGKHNLGQNLEVELGGICILSRGRKDVITKVEPSAAVLDIIQQCNLRKYGDNTLLALDLIDKLLKVVPIYRLSCTPTINAVEVCANLILK